MVNSLLKRLGVASLLILNSCSTPKSYNVSQEEYNAYLNRIEIRQEESQIPLDTKASLIEKRLFENFFDKDSGLLAKKRVNGEAREFHFEETSHLIAALSWEYAVTKNSDCLDMLKLCHKGIENLDSANGKDGFLALSLDKNEGKLIIHDNESRVGSYSQLWFAFSQERKFVPNEEIKKLREIQAERIASNLVSNNLQIVNERGKKIKWGGFYPRYLDINKSRKISLIDFYESIRRILPEETSLKKEISSIGEDLEKRGYLRGGLGTLHVEILGYNIPTPGSSFFNFLELFNLYGNTGEERYKKPLFGLTKVYPENAFFNAVMAEVTGRKDYAINAKYWLNTFPISRDSSKVFNSINRALRQEDIYVSYTKLDPHLSREFPLPIWQRPGTNQEWKKDQNRLDRHGKVIEEYSGVDFLEAYWLLRLYESKIIN